MSVSPMHLGERVATFGALLMQYGLVVVGWIGLMKFTAYEAAGIQPLVANSPLLRWAYQLLSVQAVSNVLGVTEIIVATMMALRLLSILIGRPFFLLRGALIPWSESQCIRVATRNFEKRRDHSRRAPSS